VSGPARRPIRLYPRAWRERYEEEFVALIEQRPASFRDALDVALGVLDAWLRPQVEGRKVVIYRMRSSVLGVLWAWVGVVVAGVGFQKMTEYEDFVRVARQNMTVGAAFDTVVVGAVLALAAVLVGGMPIVLAALREAIAEGRKDVPLLLCVPPLSLAAFVGYVLLVGKVVCSVVGCLTVHSLVNVALFLSIAGAFVLAAVASAASVSVAVRRSEVGERLYRFALYLAALATLAMVVVLAATVSWGVALWVQAPALFAGDDGILATPTSATWLVILAVMGGSTCAAVAAVVRGLRAGRTVETLP
jgi:hypothetical protein